jgi:hypothetical protein
MPILDAWSEVIGSPRTRTTGNSAGDFALTGPQWSGTLPAGVREIILSTLFKRIHSLPKTLL